MEDKTSSGKPQIQLSPWLLHSLPGYSTLALPIPPHATCKVLPLLNGSLRLVPYYCIVQCAQFFKPEEGGARG